MPAKAKASPIASAEVEELFQSIETFVLHAAEQFPFKLQVEKDFRGRPVLAVRIRQEGVETEIMPTLRYPE